MKALVFFTLILFLLAPASAYSTYGSPLELGNNTTTTVWIGGDLGELNMTGSAVIDGNITTSWFKGILNWSYLIGFPSTCNSSQYISSLGDSIACAAISILESQISDLRTYIVNNSDEGFNLFADQINFTSLIQRTDGIEWIKPEHVFDIDDADIESDLNTYWDIAGDTDSGSHVFNFTNSNLTMEYYFGDGSQLTGITGDNSSWNESYAKTIFYDEESDLTALLDDDYADISVISDNSSWNESYADTLYADISVIDTDTNASTACSGSATYLDGEGNCDDISSIYAPINYGDDWNETYANTIYRLQSWNNLTGIPHATPSNGDVTHFSLADEIYDWVIGLGYATTSYVDNLISSVGNWSADKSSYWDTSNDLDTVISDDEIAEGKIDFSTACAAGNHYYLSGNDLACEADDDTTYTNSSPISLSGTTFGLISCADTFIYKYNGTSGAWECEEDAGQAYSAGEGIDIVSGVISGEDATTTNKGIASFDSDDFTVSSGAVSLKSKTSYWSCAGIDFIMGDGSYYSGTGYRYNFPGGWLFIDFGDEAGAAVNLPHGAVVTGAIVNGNAGAEDQTWSLIRLTRINISTSIMTSALINTENTTISNTVIDNSVYSYFLSIDDHIADYTIYGARITYTTDYD